MYVFTGFPWVLLGYSQATVLPIAQAASVVGVFGVSAIVAAVSAALAGVVITRALRPAALVIAGVLLMAVWGNVRANNAELTREGQPIRVGVIQPNVLEEERETPGKAPEILGRDLRLTQEALSKNVSLVVWPESGLSPYTIEDFPDVAQAIRRTAQQARVPILVGSDQYQWKVEGSRREVEKSFNAAFMIGADGTTNQAIR
jgi:apolipoprotein N-acyltransferase